MRTVALLLTMTLAAGPVAAQNRPVVSPPSPSAGRDGTARDLPVSLDRIREALAREQAQPSLLTHVNRPADFTVAVEEQARIDDLLSKLDFSGSPAPAGGLHAYQQQQQLFTNTRPLQRPYAAFSGGELLTIALQNLIGRYVRNRVGPAVGAAVRSREERAAQEEVDQAVAAYCASRADRQHIKLCTDAAGR